MQAQYEHMIRRFEKSLRPGANPYYVTHVRDFLEYVEKSGGDLGRTTLRKYLERLERRYSPGTVAKTKVMFLKKLYKVNGLAWPLPERKTVKRSEIPALAPAPTPDLVKKLIFASRASGVLSFHLALVTTYGLRRREAADVEPDDIDLTSKTLRTKLSKNRYRLYPIPDAIMPYMQQPKLASATFLSYAFDHLWYAAGMKPIHGVAWQSLIRALTKGLVDAGVAVPTVEAFLRRSQSRPGWLDYPNTLVDASGESISLNTKPIIIVNEHVDQAVFRVHPFLAAWSELLPNGRSRGPVSRLDRSQKTHKAAKALAARQV